MELKIKNYGLMELERLCYPDEFNLLLEVDNSKSWVAFVSQALCAHRNDGRAFPGYRTRLKDLFDNAGIENYIVDKKNTKAVFVLKECFPVQCSLKKIMETKNFQIHRKVRIEVIARVVYKMEKRGLLVTGECLHIFDNFCSINPPPRVELLSLAGSKLEYKIKSSKEESTEESELELELEFKF